jgi:hypothetical protein
MLRFAATIARVLVVVWVDGLWFLLENCCFALDEWFAKVLESMLPTGLARSMFFAGFA